MEVCPHATQLIKLATAEAHAVRSEEAQRQAEADWAARPAEPPARFHSPESWEAVQRLARATQHGAICPQTLGTEMHGHPQAPAGFVPVGQVAAPTRTWRPTRLATSRTPWSR